MTTHAIATTIAKISRTATAEPKETDKKAESTMATVPGNLKTKLHATWHSAVRVRTTIAKANPMGKRFPAPIGRGNGRNSNAHAILSPAKRG